jgi:Ca-activated chloride channel homolog
MQFKMFMAAVAVCSWCPSFAAAQEVPIFRSSVDMVPISAVVRDGRGRAITSLTASDFEVRDNGEVRPILRFELDAGSPISVAVLIDVSGSMRLSSKLEAARDVMRELATDLRDGRDEVAVFAFASGLHELQPFTTHPSQASTALQDVDPFGVTSLYDAIAETAKRLAERPSRRRAIVVLTDGIDNSSALAPPEVSARASAIDAPVYVVATVPRIDRELYADRSTAPNARLTADARDLALWTGGDLLWASGTAEAAAATRQILAELRQQYVIAIEAAPDGYWRALDVKVRGRHMNVRTRGGYFSRTGRSDP